MRNESGTATVFDDDGHHAFIADETEMLAAMAAGMQNISLWVGDIDIFTHCRREPDQAGDGIWLSWSLDSVWCYRKPTPQADGYRHLHGQLTALWVDAAETLGALHGRVTDEWSIEQIWHLTDLMDHSMTPGELSYERLHKLWLPQLAASRQTEHMRNDLGPGEQDSPR